MMPSSSRMLQLSCQQAYQSLDEKYTHQSVLVKEASEALKASESRVTELQGELKALLQNPRQRHPSSCRSGGSPIMSRNSQRSSPASKPSNQRLLSCRDKFRCSRFLWVAKGNLPSVGRSTQEGVNLRDEVFNYVPGTVNTNRGAAVYQSPEQAFSFQKHV